MATPPFNPDETLPSPAGLISIYPGQSQTFRDIIESWLLINHDRDGEHFRLDLADSGAVLTPVAGARLLFGEVTGFVFVDNDAGAGAGPNMKLLRDSATPAASDGLGTIGFEGRSSTGVRRSYAAIFATLVTATNSLEDGRLSFQVMVAGTLTTQMQVNTTGVNVISTLTAGHLSTAGNLTVSGTVSGAGFSGFATKTGVETLTNKKLEDSTTTVVDNGDNTKAARFEASGITAGQTRVMTFPDSDGTLETTTTIAAKTRTEAMAGALEFPEDKSYTLVLNVPFAGTITSTTTKSVSGTCTATFKINATPLGGTANAVSSSEQEQTHASANAFVAGDDIVLTVSANAACADMSFTIKYTRTVI